MMCDLADNDDLDWTPLSESEMKLLAAKRERSDKISKLMGEYLLKGYKMLATTCATCQTIEMQDRSGNLYCVACSEVDTADASKDDPVINNARQQRQQVQVQPQLTGRSTHNLPLDDAARNNAGVGTAPRQLSSRVTVLASATSDRDFAEAEAIVREKMRDATERLRLLPSSDLTSNKTLVEFVKECAECVLSLKKAATS